MPVSTPSRTSATYTASISSAKKLPVYPSQLMSPSSTSSYAPTVTSNGQAMKMNAVTRIAIEGKAKQGQEGASIKMYMKLSIPVDSITPGSTIALFPEENVKILTSQVHPLDSNSVPYNFSSSASPLLHNAARALNLQARLPITFNAAYHLSSSPSIVSSSSSTNRSPELEDAPIPPVDSQYTGQILVSGYHIAYVLPRLFPSQEYARFESESEFRSHSSARGRRSSFSDRNHAHFMAAVDMWVPYATRPPRHPYLLSIPTPRCLHNNVRLRIFPPSNTAASFASLSSLEDDANTWDLTSDPHVTRTSSHRLARSGSYNHFADDESSDSSTAGFPDGFGIQGTFPSTDRIRVRWAKPMKSFEGVTESGDTRRRVGVKDVKSEMTCIIKGKTKSTADDAVEGIVMDVEYKASCKGVWFPGVATLLGMDVGLVAKNADVTWVDGSPKEWNVSGSAGYTGFNVAGGERMNNPSSRTSSVDSESPHILVSPVNNIPPTPNGKPVANSSSNPSLLRAPLPTHNIAEYSFENLNDEAASASSHLGTVSSVSSLSQSVSVNPPGAPLTLHVNINEVVPPNKIPFTITINGTILVTPRSTLSRLNGIHSTHHALDYIEATEPISLPHFSVLAADAEVTRITVQNEVNGSIGVVEVYSPSGDILKDPQTRKTVLQKGGSTRCGEGGGRIALKIIGNPHDRIPVSRPRTPISSPKSRIRSSVARTINPTGQDHISPIIHSIKAVVTPLVSRHSLLPGAYAVRIHLHSPVNETDWLEFGFARVNSSFSRTASHDDGELCSPKVHIVGASAGGVPVQYTTTKTKIQPTDNETFKAISFEMVRSTTDWASWVKIKVGSSTGDNVIIDYIVMVDEPIRPSLLSSWATRNQWDLLLPTFTLPVARLEVKLKSTKGFVYSRIHSNLEHAHISLDSSTLLHFAPDDLFSPQVSLELRREKTTSSLLWTWFTKGSILFSFFLVTLLHNMLNREPWSVRSSHEHLGNPPSRIQTNEPVTFTVTLASTVTDCSPISQGLVSMTRFPMDSPSPTRQQDESSSTSFSIMTSPAPTSSVIGSVIFSTPDDPRDSLSSHDQISLWEILGLDDLRTSLESIELPILNVSSAKETLTRYSRAVWEVVEYLLFS